MFLEEHSFLSSYRDERHVAGYALLYENALVMSSLISLMDLQQVADTDETRDRGNANPNMLAARNVSLAQLVSNLSNLKVLNLISDSNKVWSEDSKSQIQLVQAAVTTKQHWCHLQELLV